MPHRASSNTPTAAKVVHGDTRAILSPDSASAGSVLGKCAGPLRCILGWICSTFTNDLVELHLRQIPETGYISPNTVVAFLATLTRLESLQIGFQSPPSRHSPGHFHPFTRTVLPTLTKFMFLGTSEYLEDLVAQIDTPRLKYLNTTYFNQLDFQVSQLSQFLRRQELIHPTRLNDAHLEFCYFDVSIGLTSSQQPLSPSSSPKGPGLNLTILSGGLDQQTSRLTQVLTQCFAILSGVDQLFIGDRRSPRPDQEDGILNDTEWLGFFSLFTDVKSLLLSEGIARHVTRALDGSTSEAVAEALPALRQLQIWPMYPSTASVEQFTSLRRLSSQPITIVDTQRKFDREFRSFFTKRGESSG
ncbi:hypothetical protein EDB89DRAFT_714839 [Lactarius sanguifluus]|nr:hypothetical protein EDB89DRAFT_714839 [Lactarius sanguifluus]